MAMTVTCPSCSASFPVDPAKIPAGGVKARCSKCQGIIDVQPPAPEVTTVAAPGVPAVPVPEVPVSAPAPEVPTVAAPEVPIAPAPVAQPIEAAPTVEAPAAPEPLIGDPVPTPEFAAPPGDSGAGASEGTSDFGEREISFDDPAPEVEAPATPEPSAADSAFAAVEPAPAAEPALAQPSADAVPTAPAAPIQFGRRTPEDKARSLARSLVSDIIAYNTEQHQTAKAAGTLAVVFEEEVERCLKEYQEQVDPGVVQNNSFFTDALNDILADGEPVFNTPG